MNDKLLGVGDTEEEEECAVVESYGDVARPLADLEPDAVAVVGPTLARLYDGERCESVLSRKW